MDREYTQMAAGQAMDRSYSTLGATENGSAKVSETAIQSVNRRLDNIYRGVGRLDERLSGHAGRILGESPQNLAGPVSVSPPPSGCINESHDRLQNIEAALELLTATADRFASL